MSATHDKIQPLEQLAETLRELRKAGKKIAHCHGVFDLLHIGHIRHLQEAKRFGDILVVTISPDRFVNKGPHRPVFTQALRAEALAALDQVDFVAINQWPMAVETIRLLKPHFYIKGSDYRDASGDHTGGITLEEQAVHDVGGELVFTDDITFSSTNLINKHMPVFSHEVKEYLAAFTERRAISDVIGALKKAAELKVLVVGDAIIDEYQYCSAIGKSSKEPTLVVKRHSGELFPGGILAIANHAAAFAQEVTLLTLLGEKPSRESYIRQNLDPKVKPEFLFRPNAPTIVKQRFIESYFFHKLFEVYDINDEPLDAAVESRLLETLEKEVENCDLVIVGDFGHGLLTEKAIELLSDKAPFLAVNAQANAGNLGFHTIGKYAGADFISTSDLEIRLETRNRRDGVEAIIPEVSAKLDIPRVAVTRGKQGSLCYGREEGFVETPAFANQVVDRIGAGDAFFAIAALVAVQNAPLDILSFIGNAAGAQAVATVGNRHAVDAAALYKHIESLLK